MKSANEVLRRYIVGPVLRRVAPMMVTNLHWLPASGPYILVLGPHKTERESADIAATLQNVDMRFYVKKSYTTMWWNPLSWLIRWSGQIPLDRLDMKRFAEAVDNGVGVLVEGRVLVIYPEGTRYPEDDDLHPLPGCSLLVQVALKAERTLGVSVPVVPGALRHFTHPVQDGLLMRELVIGTPLYTAQFVPPLSKIMKQSARDAAVRKAMTAKLQSELASLARVNISPVSRAITES